MKNKLPFQIRLVNVDDINPRAGFVKGDVYDVYEETREGYKVMSDTFEMLVEILFSECERIIPEIETDKKGESK